MFYLSKKRTGISRTSIYAWIKEHNRQSSLSTHPINLKDFHDLKSKYERSQTIIEILQTANCLASDTVDKRYYAIEDMLKKGYNVNVLCAALCLPKGTYYNRKLRGMQGNTKAKQRRDELKPVIEEIYHNSNQIYGPGKVTAVMKDRGYTVSTTLVSKIMHENGWFSIRTGAKALYELNQKIKQNLLKQNFATNRPNEVWVSDVTCHGFNNTRYYICVVIDLYSRKVLSWNISKTNNTQLTRKTFMQAYMNKRCT